MLKTVARLVIPKIIWKKTKEQIYRSLPPGFFQFAGGWADPVTYNQDGLATAHNCDFMQDQRFLSAYNLGAETNSFAGSQIHYRVYIACWAAELALSKDPDADFIECGVFLGGVSFALCNYLKWEQYADKRKFYLVDTFKGFDQRFLSDYEKKREAVNRFYESFETVKKTFGKYSNVQLVRGPVPESLDQIRESCKKIAFAHIDMNCVMPEVKAAEFIWPRLIEGGIILLDDYGWINHEEQKNALDAFAKSQGRRILSLPTGQGMLVK